MQLLVRKYQSKCATSMFDSCLCLIRTFINIFSIELISSYANDFLIFYEQCVKCVFYEQCAILAVKTTDARKALILINAVSWFRTVKPPFLLRISPFFASLSARTCVMKNLLPSGGCDGAGHSSAVVEKFDPKTVGGSWTTIRSLNFARSAHGACVVGGTLYVVGG